MWEALDKASYYRLRQPDRDRRRQPPRPARPDRTGLGHSTRTPSGSRRSAATPSSSTATTSARSTRRFTEAADGGPAHGDRGPHPQGPRLRRGRGPRGLARPGAARADGGAGHHRAGRRAPPDRHRAAARGRVAPGLARRRGEPAPLRAGRQGRHPAGLRPGAGRGRRPRPTSSPWTARWATPPTGGVRQGPSRAVLRDVHRRAAARRHRGRPVRPRVHPVRRHVRRVLHPGLRLHPDVGHLAGEHPAVRLARGRRDRRGRPVPDGPGGPGHDAGRARLDRAVPQRRDQRGLPDQRDGRTRRRRLHAHHPRARTRCCTGRTRRSRSAARRSSAPARRTR